MLIPLLYKVKSYLCCVKATLIISVYNDVASLKAVLRTVALQTEKAFDVIVSQDGDDPCFDALLQSYRSSLSLQHIQQPDTGFLKNRMLNRAVKLAKSDRLIFIDGDCILHRKFVAQYVKHIQPNRLCMGRRIDLDPITTQCIKTGQQLFPSTIQMIRNKTTRVEEGFYVPFVTVKKASCLGCNMGWHRSDLVRLNGFDEAYTFPGFGEDTDMEFRAQRAGIQSYSMRFKAIQYHLDHSRPDRENQVSKSQLLFESKKKRADFRCENGIEKLV